MSELTKQLLAASEQHEGTGLGGLLQWAVLHINEQDAATLTADKHCQGAMDL